MATTKSRNGSKSRTSRGKSPGRSKPPAKKASGRPAPPSRVREAARTQLGGHGTDALALGVLVLGLLSGLALATDLTGPVGRALGGGLTALLGNGAFLVPLALVAVASCSGGAAPTTRPRLRRSASASGSPSWCSRPPA